MSVDEMSTIAKVGWPLLIAVSAVAIYRWRKGSGKSSSQATTTGSNIGTGPQRPQRTLGGLWNSGPSTSEKYLIELEKQYPKTHPNFFHGAFRDLTEQAQAINRPIFLVIHAPPPTLSTPDAFTRDVICTELVSDTVKQNFIGYFLVAHTPEAAQLTRALAITEFPSVCVLVPKSHVQIISLLKTRGPSSAQELFGMLLQALDRKDNISYRATDEKSIMQHHLQSERQLREYQDLEYEQAVEQDRQKEKESENKRKEQERIQKQEEEERLKAENLRAEANRIAEQRQQLREELKKSLPPPPTPSPSAMTVGIRLPNGKKIQRNFNSDEPLRTVLQFIDSHELFTQENEPIIPPTLSFSTSISQQASPLVALSLYPHQYPYRVVTTHPRHVFTDANLELKELGLGKNCLLIVETIAESSSSSITDDGEEEEDEEEDEEEEEAS